MLSRLHRTFPLFPLFSLVAASTFACSAAPHDVDEDETTGAASAALTASDSRYVVTPGATWVARHGLTASAYQAAFDAFVGQGFRLTYVNGYASGNQALYAAIWEKSAGPAWVAKHGMTAAQYQAAFDAELAAGYRLVLVNGYTVGGVDYYAALWDKAPSGPWQAKHGMTAAEYQTTFDTLVAQGYRLRHVSGYGAGGAERYAAVFEKTSGPAWVAKHGMTAAQYQQQFDAENAAGYHLALVNGYPVGNDVHYAAIWEQGTAAPSQARHGLTAAAYQQTFDDLRYQGYRPVSVSGYATPNGDDYAALWENYEYSAADLAHIDGVVAGVMNGASVPGLSLAIAKGGQLKFAKAYGFADKATGAPVTTSSRFRIASVSKPFTATGIMKLVDAGKLHLSDKVFGAGSILGTTYTTKPKDARIDDITLQEILTHTSGLYPNDGNDPMFKNYAMSQSQLITWALENMSLASKPGSTYAYSNFGFLVLGRVIEKVTGQAYDAWMKANVMGPAGISDMQIAASTEAGRANGEVVYASKESPDAYGIDVSRMDSHGGWIATPIDLTRFMIHLDGFSPPADLLSAADETTMTTPTSQSIAAGSRYGFGLSLTTANTWWHNGSLPGTTAILVRTSNQLVWSALTNTRDGSPDIDDMMWNVVNGVSAWPAIDLYTDL